MRILLFITLALFSQANANSIKANIGITTMNLFIPVIATELEYLYLGHYIRVGYASNYSFEIFGSSRYEKRYFDFSVYSKINDTSKQNIFFTFGEGERRDNNFDKEKYIYQGIGYEWRNNTISSFTLGDVGGFIRLGFNYVRTHDRIHNDRESSSYPFATFGFDVNF